MIFPLYKHGFICYNTLVLKKCTGGSMDRASDSGSEGWGFESLPVYHSENAASEKMQRFFFGFLCPAHREKRQFS